MLHDKDTFQKLYLDTLSHVWLQAQGEMKATELASNTSWMMCTAGKKSLKPWAGAPFPLGGYNDP